MLASPGIKLRSRLGEPSSDWISALCWSPDGQTLAASTLDNKLNLWNLGNFSLKASLEMDSYSVCLEWIDNEVLALAPVYDIELWDYVNNERTARFEGHSSSVFHLAWSAGRRLLASASGDQTVRLWHPESLASIGKLTGHGSDVMCVCWVDKYLLSGAEDGKIRHWTGPLGVEGGMFAATKSIVNCMAWCPASALLASCGIGSDEVSVWDSRGTQRQRLKGHTSGVTWVSFSSDGRLLASTSWDGTVRLWRCDSWKPVAVLDARNSENHFIKLAFHPHLPLLATLDEEGSIIVLWDLEVDTLLGGRRAPWTDNPGSSADRPAAQSAHERRQERIDAGSHHAADVHDRLTASRPDGSARQPSAEAELAEAPTTLRTAFDAALMQLRSQLVAQSTTPRAPSCFVSYAWGVPDHEAWVERRLANDLSQAGIEVILDRWENMAIGSSIARFMSRIAASDTVLVVGSPLYREKYENRRPEAGFAVAAEVDLINQRLLGSEAAKSSVLPVLLAGDEPSSLPPLLRGRVWGDFRTEETYLTTLFDLIVTLYGMPFSHPVVISLRDSLQHRRRWWHRQT